MLVWSLSCRFRLDSAPALHRSVPGLHGGEGHRERRRHLRDHETDPGSPSHSQHLQDDRVSSARHVWMPQVSYTIGLNQRFSIPVLAPPRSAYFVCYSYRFRCLFYWNVSALRSGHHRIFLHDSSSKRTYIFHSKCIEVCETWIKIVYIYRGIWCHTRPCVKTLRSANPWMNVQK